MTRGVLVGVVLVLAGVMAGCGNDDGGDSKRTDLACAMGTQSCGTLHSDVPIVMSCADGYDEVETCPEENVLATCTQESGSWHLLRRIYDASSLVYWQTKCANDDGTWQTYSN